jgi:hypothetical protein
MKITTASQLDFAILQLEQKRTIQEKDLVEHFNTTYQSLRPLNLIKGAIEDIAGSPEIRDNVINAAIGVGTGFVTKKLLVGKSDSLFKKILGGAIEFGVANIVAKNTDAIKAYGTGLINRFFKHKEQEED